MWNIKLCQFLVLDPIYFHFVIDELIDVGYYSGALDVHQDEAGDDLRLEGGVGPGG